MHDRYFKNSFCVIPFMQEIPYSRGETKQLSPFLVTKRKDSWQPPNPSRAPLLRTKNVGHLVCKNQYSAPCRPLKLIWWVPAFFLDEGKPLCVKLKVEARERKSLRTAGKMKTMQWKRAGEKKSTARTWERDSYKRRSPTYKTQATKAEMRKKCHFSAEKL